MSGPNWQEVERAIAGALEQPDEQRQAYLVGLPAAVRAEVESLLAAHVRAGSFLDEPATGTMTPAQPRLSPGAKLGPYSIDTLLGQGGMGEVFKAQDSRLGRWVAIKVLAADKVNDPERKSRFIQEARAVSALNHPHIVTLYDIAHSEGLDFLVMEYVAGQSLDRLVSSQSPQMLEAVRYAAQIANALMAAHAAGIVHRDIKPANVIVTSESQVKVLDFGLAKLDPQTQAQSHRFTLTEAGTVMGTVAYMSPEQASGRAADHRTDIFSLGVVLYEMLAGERPFRGGAPVETLHAILNDPVKPLTAVNPLLPPELDEVVARALAKEPRERYQHAGDLELDLRRFERAWENKSLPSMRGIAPEAARLMRSRSRRSSRLAALAAGSLIGAAGMWLARGIVSPPGNPLASATFTRFTDWEGVERDAAVSPDGKFVAFSADRDGQFDVWLSRVGTGQFVNLTQGKEPNLDPNAGVRETGFAGDGSELWMHDSEKTSMMRLIPLIGGPARIFLGKGPGKTPPAFAAWSPDGARVVFHTSDAGDPMFTADRNGAGARRILLERPGIHQHWEAWSPDGHWIYFAKGDPFADEWDLWRVAASGGTAERLTHHNSYVASPAPIDSRTVLYVAREQDGSGPWLWALDVHRKTTRRVSFGLEEYTSVSASNDGRRLAATVANPTATLWSVPILDQPADERAAKPFSVPTVRALAPRFGGSSLFYLSSRGGGDGLWRYQDGKVSEIWRSVDGQLLLPAAISPGGQRAALVLRANGRLNLSVISADGGDFRPLSAQIDVRGSGCWSPDGKWVVTGGDDAQGTGLFKVPADGGPPARIVAGPALNPVCSPDGALIVYTGADVGGYAPLIAVHPDGSRVDLPDVNVFRGGERVRFLPNGRGLVYIQGVNAAQNFWLLDLATKKNRRLTTLHNNGTIRAFDITPDGRNIVFDRLRESSDIVLIDLARSGR